MGLLGIEGIEQETVLGRGAFGVVYRAWQPSLQRAVAVKVLVGAYDDTALARFERECATIGSLSGEPGILTVHAAGRTPDGSPYLITPYLPGGSLGDRLATGPLGPDEVVSVGLAVGRALAAAHRRGVLHLDVKPANVLVDAQGRHHLADFGIARFIDAEQRGHTATIAGTPGFAAPEIFDGRQPTVRSDVYGLGATLHALAGGRTPFTLSGAGGLSGLLHQIAHDEPPDLRPDGVPDALCAVIERAMAKDPEQRFASMDQLVAGLAALDGAAAGEPRGGTATPAAPRPDRPGGGQDPETLDEEELLGRSARRRRHRAVAVAAVAALAVAGATGLVAALVGSGGDGEGSGGGAPAPSIEPGETPGTTSDAPLWDWLAVVTDVHRRVLLNPSSDQAPVCRDGLEQVEERFGTPAAGADAAIPDGLRPAVEGRAGEVRALWSELVDAYMDRFRECAAGTLTTEADAASRARIVEASSALRELIEQDGAGAPQPTGP